jgi:magnesium transporter
MNAAMPKLQTLQQRKDTAGIPVVVVSGFSSTGVLPPSVVGAFYGMNFEHIPWLHERWGVWAALAMMAISALVPYLYFKGKRWL